MNNSASPCYYAACNDGTESACLDYIAQYCSSTSDGACSFYGFGANSTSTNSSDTMQESDDSSCRCMSGGSELIGACHDPEFCLTANCNYGQWVCDSGGSEASGSGSGSGASLSPSYAYCPAGTLDVSGIIVMHPSLGV